jgi:CheY-like chemotaxis protein
MDSLHRALRVLVVDDCQDHVSLLSMLLRFWGHQPCAAYDGPTALELALIHRPDVAILDLELPGSVDGWEVARRLCARPETKNIILAALTGCTRARHRQRCVLAGFGHFLLKPADPEELKQVLARCTVGHAVPPT